MEVVFVVSLWCYDIEMIGRYGWNGICFGLKMIIMFMKWKVIVIIY